MPSKNKAVQPKLRNGFAPDLRHHILLAMFQPLDSADSRRSLRLTTIQDTPTPTKYKAIITAITRSIVKASGVGVTIAATTSITSTAYLVFWMRQFGVTMSNRVRKRMSTGSSDTR